MLQLFKSANPEELQSELVHRLGKLDHPAAENTSADSAESSSQEESSHTSPFQTSEDIKESPPDLDDNHNGMMKNLGSLSLDWVGIKNALLSRVDLSEVEIEDVWHQLQSLYQQLDSTKEDFKPAF